MMDMRNGSPLEDSTELRRAVIATALAMNTAGINVNTSGNVSARCARGTRVGFVITPSAVPYAELAERDLVFVDNAEAMTGAHRPSSEWRFHFAIYAARDDVGAIVHTHSPHATALACQQLDIPSFHYMVAVAGGSDIRCAPYATFGTQELADHALAALDGRRACLLAHHGVIACGPDLKRAFALAVEVENLARTYIAVRALGTPKLLADAEMTLVLKRFATYGQLASD
jgi:L-fuculose-phosphate aldolase